jgi:hypothetical protein
MYNTYCNDPQNRVYWWLIFIDVLLAQRFGAFMMTENCLVDNLGIWNHRKNRSY